MLNSRDRKWMYDDVIDFYFFLVFTSVLIFWGTAYQSVVLGDFIIQHCSMPWQTGFLYLTPASSKVCNSS